MVTHGLDTDGKRRLLRACCEAAAHAVIIIEHFIDDERRTHTLGLLMSLHMRLEMGTAHETTFQEMRTLCLQAGFARTEVMTLDMGAAVIAFKRP